MLWALYAPSWFFMASDCWRSNSSEESSTSTVENSVSREIFFGPGTNPDISYWFFKTMTGLTGVGLYCTMVVIFIFTLPLIRKKAYRFFWMVRVREIKEIYFIF